MENHGAGETHNNEDSSCPALPEAVNKGNLQWRSCLQVAQETPVTQMISVVTHSCMRLVGDGAILVTRAPGAIPLLTHAPVSHTNRSIHSASSFTLVCHCLVCLGCTEIVSTQEQPNSVPLQTQSRIELTNSEGPPWKNVTFPSDSECY